MPLTIAPLDQDLRIVALKGDAKVVKRLQDLGLVKDAIITTSGSQGGSLVVHLGSSRLAIDKEVASMIRVAVLG